MIPGRNRCDNGWHTEYVGYLAAEKSSHYRTEFVCVDSEAEANPDGSSANENGASLFAAQGRCGSLPCGPYGDQRDLLCVVCSR